MPRRTRNAKRRVKRSRKQRGGDPIDDVIHQLNDIIRAQCIPVFFIIDDGTDESLKILGYLIEHVVAIYDHYQLPKQIAWISHLEKEDRSGARIVLNDMINNNTSVLRYHTDATPFEKYASGAIKRCFARSDVKCIIVTLSHAEYTKDTMHMLFNTLLEVQNKKYTIIKLLLNRTMAPLYIQFLDKRVEDIIDRIGVSIASNSSVVTNPSVANAERAVEAAKARVARANAELQDAENALLRIINVVHRIIHYVETVPFMDSNRSMLNDAASFPEPSRSFLFHIWNANVHEWPLMTAMNTD